MSAGIAHNWWTIGLRGAVTVIFGLVLILLLPRATTASLAMLFTAYVAADGFFAVLMGLRKAKQPRRSWSQIMEGFTNLAVAGGVLLWPAIASVALLHVLSIWAIVSGALMLAAAHRLSATNGRWILAFAGAVSTGWGILLATFGPDAAAEPDTMAGWLIAYAALFGITLLVLGVHLRRHHRASHASAHDWRHGRITTGARPP